MTWILAVTIAMGIVLPLFVLFYNERSSRKIRETQSKQQDTITLYKANSDQVEAVLNSWDTVQKATSERMMEADRQLREARKEMLEAQRDLLKARSELLDCRTNEAENQAIMIQLRADQAALLIEVTALKTANALRANSVPHET